jgi:hypothetical protein
MRRELKDATALRDSRLSNLMRRELKELSCSELSSTPESHEERIESSELVAL